MAADDLNELSGLQVAPGAQHGLPAPMTATSPLTNADLPAGSPQATHADMRSRIAGGAVALGAPISTGAIYGSGATGMTAQRNAAPASFPAPFGDAAEVVTTTAGREGWSWSSKNDQEGNPLAMIIIVVICLALLGTAFFYWHRKNKGTEGSSDGEQPLMAAEG